MNYWWLKLEVKDNIDVEGLGAAGDSNLKKVRFKKNVTVVVQDRATQLAKEEVHGVAHTMGLEDQRPTDERIQKQVVRRAEELLRGKWSDLWR